MSPSKVAQLERVWLSPEYFCLPWHCTWSKYSLEVPGWCPAEPEKLMCQDWSWWRVQGWVRFCEQGGLSTPGVLRVGAEGTGRKPEEDRPWLSLLPGQEPPAVRILWTLCSHWLQGEDWVALRLAGPDTHPATLDRNPVTRTYKGGMQVHQLGL